MYRMPQNKRVSSITADLPVDAKSTQDTDDSREKSSSLRAFGRREARGRCISATDTSLTYIHVRLFTHTHIHTLVPPRWYTRPLSRQYRKLKDWPMIARRTVAFLPLGGKQPPPIEPTSRRVRLRTRAEKEKKTAELLSENCGFTCERIAVRLPNATR